MRAGERRASEINRGTGRGEVTRKKRRADGTSSESPHVRVLPLIGASGAAPENKRNDPIEGSGGISAAGRDDP